MSSGLTKDQTDQFEQLFYSFDTDKDGWFLENNLRKNVLQTEMNT